MQNNISDNLNKWDYISNYSTWMYHIYESYVGKRVFDVGAGMGRMVGYYIDQCEKVIATDIFQNQVDYMNERFKDYPNFKATIFDVMTDDLKQYEESFDTVICINVLEHLEDDLQAVKNMKKLLCENGHLILFVPAFQKLYCQLDKNVSHYRRYNKGQLKTLAEQCDMEVVKNIYFNALGVIPYYLKGKKRVKEDESFSTGLNENNSKIYNFASKILEPIEKAIPPVFGISDVIVLKKRGLGNEINYTNSML